MGFMAGFGPAFSDAFNAGNDRRAKRKDDLFKLTYSEFLDRREKYEKKKESDSKLIGSAKTLARDLAGNEEYWPKVYDWLQSGMSENTILELIQNGEFETALTATPEVQDIGPPEEVQMADSGLANPTAEMPAAQSDVAQMAMPEQDSGMMGKLFPGMAQAKRDRDINRSLDQVSQVSGMKREEIDQIMKGTGNTAKTDSSGIVYKRKPTPVEPDKINTPEESWIEQTHAQREYDLNPTATNEVRLQKANDRVRALKDLETIKQEARARADAAKEGRAYGFFSAKKLDENGKFMNAVLVEQAENGFYKTESGELIPQNQVQRWKDGEFDDYKKVASATAKLGGDHVTKRSSNVKELIYLSKDMATIVNQTSGAVLAQRTSGLASLAVDWAQELKELSRVLTDDNIANDKNAAQKLNELDDTVSNLLKKNITDLATQRGLLEAKAKIFAYKLGMAMGQEGRSLVEVERKVFEDLGLGQTGGTSTPQKFNQNLANIVSDQVRSLDSAAIDLNNYNIEMEAFQNLYHWKEPPFETVPSFGKMLAREPELQDAYNYFKPFMNLDINQESQETVINGYKIRKRN